MQEKSYPFYIKATVVLLGLTLFIFILSILSDVMIPFAMSGLIAILLNPLVTRLQRRMPKVLAICCAMLLTLIVLFLIFFFLSRQIAQFGDSIPQLEQKFTLILQNIRDWVQTNFGVSIKRQIEMVRNAVSGGQHFLASTLGTILGMLGVVLLIPIYVFLLLYYKPLMLDFLFQVFKEQNSLRVAEILSETKSAVQSYMVGLMLETAIVCTLNSVALLIIGVPNAIVIGVIGGILNILPYIGGIIAIALPVLMATVVSEGFSMQIAVILSYLVIQFIDNNILVPRIVSSKVQINALVSILVVLLGGSLWGISGMFLSIPFTAVVKIIFDRIDELKPWGKLLGNEVPTEHAGVEFQKRWNRIFKRIEKSRTNDK